MAAFGNFDKLLIGIGKALAIVSTNEITDSKACTRLEMSKTENFLSKIILRFIIENKTRDLIKRVL